MLTADCFSQKKNLKFPQMQDIKFPQQRTFNSFKSGNYKYLKM